MLWTIIKSQERDDLHDNGLAVLEYPQATATIRTAVVETEGFKRRQFVVCGDQGTIDIRPIEPLWPKTGAINLQLALAQPKGGFKAGYHFGAISGPVAMVLARNRTVMIGSDERTEHCPTTKFRFPEASLKMRVFSRAHRKMTWHIFDGAGTPSSRFWPV